MQKELDERKQTEAEVTGAQRRLRTIQDKTAATESELEGLRSRITVLTKGQLADLDLSVSVIQPDELTRHYSADYRA